MKRINDAVLQPGDIILTTSTAKISKAIRVFTSSDISHAMVCVEGYSVMDATAEGVQARNTQRLFYDTNNAVHILRMRDGIAKEELNAVLLYMRGHTGTQYSTKEAVMTALGGLREPTKKQFCSRLVAQAFRSAGISLVANADFCSPADLKASALLVEIPDATVDIEDEEVSKWEDRTDGTQLTRDAINVILNGARAKNPSIQTFDDLHIYLASHPEQDGYFCDLLDVSGYLSLWQIEKQKNPWLYDLAHMNTAPFEQMKAYCLSTLADEDAVVNRYVINRGAYSRFAKEYGLRFFVMMAELYDFLAALHLQRIRVATDWLKANGFTVLASEPHLVPHTPEWFESMRQWDPIKAMMTEAAIRAEGNLAVCSICGDDPASDYALKYQHRTLGGPGTLRLCDDCLEIQNDGGDLFEPLN